MHLLNSQRGAELSEIVVGLLVILVAGVAAVNIMFNGLDDAATKISAYITGLIIPAP